jgi:flagellar biosynthetic protein FliQ
LTRQENLVTDSSVLNIGVQSIIMATKLAAPMLGVSLGIGLFIGLIQSATQIQEQTLTFVPKLAGVAIVIIIMGNWMLSQLITFTHQLFEMIPQLLQ